MRKKTSRAFGKDIYLLGADEDGVRYWLEAPSWDCGWYWGFGYIETYTNNRSPENSRDINSHQHADGEYKGDGHYDTNLFTGGFLKDKSFSEDEGWKLRELFATFYQLRSEADFYHRGNSHQSAKNALDFKDQARADYINQNMIPKVTAAILAVLTPEERSAKNVNS